MCVCVPMCACTCTCAASASPHLPASFPSQVLAASKYVTDLTKQCIRVGELRTAVAEGAMVEGDVYAELGEIVNGTKVRRSEIRGRGAPTNSLIVLIARRQPGREGDELIVVDLTGTGAQDAAIGQVAWDKMSKM